MKKEIFMLAQEVTFECDLILMEETLNVEIEKKKRNNLWNQFLAQKIRRRSQWSVLLSKVRGTSGFLLL